MIIQAFYAEYRIAVGFSGFQGLETNCRPQKWTNREAMVQERSVKWAMVAKLVLSLLHAPDEERIPRTDADGCISFPKIGGLAGEYEDPEVTLASELLDWEGTYFSHLTREEMTETIYEWPISRNGKSKIIIYVEYVKTVEYLIRVSPEQKPRHMKLTDPIRTTGLGIVRNRMYRSYWVQSAVQWTDVETGRSYRGIQGSQEELPGARAVFGRECRPQPP